MLFQDIAKTWLRKFISPYLSDQGQASSVVRHRCANRLCINLEHLELGGQGDNKRDDWDHCANGIDFDLL